MATMTERLRFIFEADTKSVEKAFGKVRAETTQTATQRQAHETTIRYQHAPHSQSAQPRRCV